MKKNVNNINLGATYYDNAEYSEASTKEDKDGSESSFDSYDEEYSSEETDTGTETDTETDEEKIGKSNYSSLPFMPCNLKIF